MGRAFYDCNEVLLSTRTNVLLKNREAPVVPPFLVGTCLFSIEQSASFRKRAVRFLLAVTCFLYIQRIASLREHATLDYPYFIISFFLERFSITQVPRSRMKRERATCHIHAPRATFR